MIILTLIMISTTTFVMDTRREYEGNPVLALIEAICIIVFTIEYLAKFCTAPNRYQYFTGGASEVPTGRPRPRPVTLSTTC